MTVVAAADHGQVTTAVEDEAVGIGFAPSVLFDRTPGPGAGERLGPKV
jgi:hypothetical protein